MGIVIRNAAAGVLAACVLFTVTPTSSDQAEGTDAYRSGDYERALAIWKPLAERGERGSQFCLGVLFHLGRGMEKDLAEAQKWYVLAAKRGHADARKQALALRKRMTQAQLADARRRIEAWAKAFEPNMIDGVAGPDRGGIGITLKERSRKKVRGLTEICYQLAASGLSPENTYRVTMWPYANLAENRPEALVVDDANALASGELELTLNLCFDRYMKGEWCSFTFSSKDGTQVASTKAYPFPLEARQGNARIWLEMLPPAGRRFAAFGEGFQPDEVLTCVFYMDGKETRRVVTADAEGRLGAAIIPLLVIHDDGICRWSLTCESGTLTVPFASGPTALELQ